MVMAVASVTGAGTSAPTVAAASGTANKPGRNLATGANISRSAEGVYSITIAAALRPPVVSAVLPSVRGPDGRKATVTSYTPSTGVLLVKAWSVAGVADDLETTDQLDLVFVAADSTAS